MSAYTYCLGLLCFMLLLTNILMFLCNVPWLSDGELRSMRITGDAALSIAHGEVEKKHNSVRISFRAFITN
jgi:hypothetical protein